MFTKYSGLLWCSLSVTSYESSHIVFCSKKKRSNWVPLLALYQLRNSDFDIYERLCKHEGEQQMMNQQNNSTKY